MLCLGACMQGRMSEDAGTARSFRMTPLSPVHIHLSTFYVDLAVQGQTTIFNPGLHQSRRVELRGCRRTSRCPRCQSGGSHPTLVTTQGSFPPVDSTGPDRALRRDRISHSLAVSTSPRLHEIVPGLILARCHARTHTDDNGRMKLSGGRETDKASIGDSL